MYYMLKQRKVIKTIDQKKWLKWMAKNANSPSGIVVAGSKLRKVRATVYTYFRGLPVTGSFQKGQLGLFETSICGGEWHGLIRNCDTYAEALKQHKECCKLAVQKSNGKSAYKVVRKTLKISYTPTVLAIPKSAKRMAKQVNKAAKQVLKEKRK